MIRLGIVGCGAVTERHHLRALKRVRDITVVALADQDRSRLDRLGEEYRVRERYQTYGELLEAGNIDAVAVCLPPQFHAEVALAALKHGKHVFIEKPLALNLEDCDRLIEANERDPSRKAMVGFNLRWHRLVRQAREIIHRNELGAVHLVRTVFTTRKQSGGWRASPDAGGGVLFDLGVHHFDIVRFLLGSEVQEIDASATNSNETATVLLSMRNGTKVVCAFTHGTGENQALEIYGADGWLRVSCYRPNGLEQFRTNDRPGVVASRLRATTNSLFNLPDALYRSWRGGDVAASYVEEWNHFGQAILWDKPTEADLIAGRRALGIALIASKGS